MLLGAKNKDFSTDLTRGLVSSAAQGTKYSLRRLTRNGPFPSCCLSWFRSESWCSTVVREMSLICIRIHNSFPFEWLSTGTHFETEACSNSEMSLICIRIHNSFPFEWLSTGTHFETEACSNSEMGY